MPQYLIALLVVILTGSSSLFAANLPLKSPYAGEHKRSIKTLSKHDIEQLQNGKGWGMAKAAELNGVPGPAHILEMKAEIDMLFCVV